MNCSPEGVDLTTLPALIVVKCLPGCYGRNPSLGSRFHGRTAGFRFCPDGMDHPGRVAHQV